MESFQNWVRNFKLAFAIAVVSSFFPESTHANVVGPVFQNFNTTSGGIDFLTVHSSETLEPGVFNVGIFANYAINSLPIFDDGEQVQKRTKINDSLIMTDFNFGLGLFQDLEIGFSYPRLVSQKVSQNVPRGQFGGTGNTEIRLMLKYRIVGNSNSGIATIVSTNIDRTRNNPYSGVDADPTINLEFAGDLKFSNFATGVNVGYRKFQSGVPLPGNSITPTEDQIILSLASSYHASSLDTKLISEIFASTPSKEQKIATSNRQVSTMEVLLGIKYDITSNIAFQSGVGTELISGTSSPDWRVYAGVNISGGSIFGEKEEPVEIVTKSKTKKVKRREKLKVVKGETAIRLFDVQFPFDGHDKLLIGSFSTLAFLQKYLLKIPVFKTLIIEGHTDSVGSEEYNRVLSLKRAKHIRKVMIEKFGLDGSKITAEGFGEGKPISDNGNYQGRQRNRRVVFRVYR